MTFGLIVQLVVVAIILYFILWVYTAQKRSRQVYCIYYKVNNDIEEMFVDVKDRYVFFDRKKFELINSCIRYTNWRRGIFMLVPIKVGTIAFTWQSDLPINPDTGEVYNMISPSVRNSMNQEEWMMADQRGADNYRKAENRGGFLQKYGVVIAIALIALLGIWVWMQTKGLDASITILGNYYKDLLDKVNAIGH
jgi:hypothetical protein